MQQKNKRRQQAEQTKDKLFYAANQLLAEREFEQITVRDIVARAGVSVGTFYHHYTNKMEVYYETYRLADRYFTETVAPQLTQPDPAQRILAFFDHYALYSSKTSGPRLTRLLYNADNPWFNRDPADGMVGLLTKLVAAGLQSGSLRGADRAEQIAGWLMVAARGLVYHWCTAGCSYDLPAAMRWYVARLIKAYTL
ncbi:MAG: TetR/AcrR family transcriptional regulator [Faecalibacterium sp.]|nr:TetR/AcrR family transcriptional regulator [Faecalibacterium sp.]